MANLKKIIRNIISENFESGNRQFTFEEIINEYGQVHIFNKPSGWGEIDDIKGKIGFSCNMWLRRNGIESFHFYLDTINLEITTIVGDEVNEQIKEEQLNIPFVDNSNVNVELGGKSFYFSELTIDMRGSIEPSNFKYNFEIGG